MTVLVELFFSGGTTEQYDRLVSRLSLDRGDSAAPEGMLSHAAVATERGLRIVDLWDSEQAFQSFFAPLRGIIEEIGIPAPEQPTVTAVHHFLLQGHGPAAVTPPALPLDFPIRHG